MLFFCYNGYLWLFFVFSRDRKVSFNGVALILIASKSSSFFKRRKKKQKSRRDTIDCVPDPATPLRSGTGCSNHTAWQPQIWWKIELKTNAHSPFSPSFKGANRALSHGRCSRRGIQDMEQVIDILKPPLCKGRWHALAWRRDCKKTTRSFRFLPSSWVRGFPRAWGPPTWNV